jgi:hypothetical protein
VHSKRNKQQNKKTTHRKRKIFAKFASHMSNKGLIFKIYKELLQFNSINENKSHGLGP